MKSNYHIRQVLLGGFLVCNLTACSSHVDNRAASDMQTFGLSPQPMTASAAVIEMDAYYAAEDNIKIMQQQAEQQKVELAEAEFSTKFNTGNSNRANNIKIAATAINAKVIQPGEVFSFNEAVGDTSKEQGYKLAKIFVKGKDSKGYGGGVCQVSTTLFNAADLCGLEIVERHPHSKKVTYVPKDRDAATSHGGIDLKIKNTKSYPITINAGVEKNMLTIKLTPQEII